MYVVSDISRFRCGFCTVNTYIFLHDLWSPDMLGSGGAREQKSVECLPWKRPTKKPFKLENFLKHSNSDGG